MRKGKHSYKGG